MTTNDELLREGPRQAPEAERAEQLAERMSARTRRTLTIGGVLGSLFAVLGFFDLFVGLATHGRTFALIVAAGVAWAIAEGLVARWRRKS